MSHDSLTADRPVNRPSITATGRPVTLAALEIKRDDHQASRRDRRRYAPGRGSGPDYRPWAKKGHAFPCLQVHKGYFLGQTPLVIHPPVNSTASPPGRNWGFEVERTLHLPSRSTVVNRSGWPPSQGIRQRPKFSWSP